MRLAIDSRLDLVRSVGQGVRAFCLERGVDETLAGMLELAVVEAVNNAIKHAYANQPGHQVEVDLLERAGALEFVIRDWGKAIEPREPSAPKVDPGDIASLPEGGMGLYIMSQVMDEMRFASRDGENTLTLTKTRPW